MNTENRSLAAQHADSLAASIIARTDAGYPFGLRRESDDAYAADLDELRADYPDAWEDDDDPDEIPTGWQDASGMDYLSDALDIQYVVGSDRQYRSARMAVGFGGPNVWIDTRDRELIVTWWSAPETRALPAAFIYGLDGACRDLWEMGA